MNPGETSSRSSSPQVFHWQQAYFSVPRPPWHLKSHLPVRNAVHHTTVPAAVATVVRRIIVRDKVPKVKANVVRLTAAQAEAENAVRLTIAPDRVRKEKENVVHRIVAQAEAANAVRPTTAVVREPMARACAVPLMNVPAAVENAVPHTIVQAIDQQS